MLNKTRILTNNTTKNKKIQKFLYFGFILIFPIFLLTPFILFSQTSQSYTSSGEFPWTCPAGITKVDVECWGGGGAGAGNKTKSDGGGGGGGGAYSKSEITVVPGTTYTVNVGSGGTRGTGNGSNGEDSWFID
ncbi:MAG TPA: hypothetical protein PL028_08915, partial [Bacteroidales bacterium]|nr:hypothetical protein [Bacteroidales bacterium]